ncbi:MAG: hypothetical protein P8Y14_26975 [Anaerolineales bacterium]
MLANSPSGPTPPPALSSDQLAIVQAPLDAKIFLEGPAGSGKTTAGVERLLHLMASGVLADSILLLVPQRTLATPYYQALQHPGVVAGGMVDILTVGGLAQRMLDLFWPLVAAEAGFARPDDRPTFLTLETAQYYMARLVRPLLEQGYFEAVAVHPNRLYSQILDNLNKAAAVGLPFGQIGERLKAAWVGEPGQLRVYSDAQECANRFRQYCLDHNLLDFSLQLQVFWEHLWPQSLVQEHLTRTYRHLIVDNLEEDSPRAHDLLADWLPQFDSALLIYDQGAGYRTFLSADPVTAYQLKSLSERQVVFEESFATSPQLESFGSLLEGELARKPAIEAYQRYSGPLGQRIAEVSLTEPEEPSAARISTIRTALEYAYHRFHPEMLDWVAERIAELVFDQQVPPGEIVVLAPFLSDALRFSLTNRLTGLGVPARSHRPSRALREEPAAECLLTLAAFAHPSWGILPTRFDLAYALIQAIDGMDLVRAQLLSEIVYRIQESRPALGSFDRLTPEMQARITYLLGGRYEELRAWIEAYRRGPVEEIDHFLSRLFGEVLSQEGYGFHRDFDAGEVAANLVESARKFRWVAAESLAEDGKPVGQEYVEMVEDGVVAAQYLRSWQVQAEEAVLLAPAYTFLMANRPVDYQFWLDIGGRGWFERLYQPLTHPYVLSREWPARATWTDVEEYTSSQETLERLSLGLIRRCRRKVYLGLSELSEQGYEHKGPLLQAMQRVLRRIPTES